MSELPPLFTLLEKHKLVLRAAYILKERGLSGTEAEVVGLLIASKAATAEDAPKLVEAAYEDGILSQTIMANGTA